MKDESLANEVRAENLREEFYQYLVEGGWEACRESIALLKEMHISTLSLEKELATAMDDEKSQYESEDFTNSKGLDV